MRPILAEAGVEIKEPHKGMGENCIKAYEEWKAEQGLKYSVTPEERMEMEARILDWLSEENLTKAAGMTREQIFEEFGNQLEPIAYLPMASVRYVGDNLTDERIYSGKGYFIDHAMRNHAKEGKQTAVEDIDVSKYLNIQNVLDNPDSIKETFVDGKRTVIFIKKIGRYFAELTQVEENGKIVLHKSFFNQKKEPYAKLADIRSISPSLGGGVSPISHADDAAPAISLQSRNDDELSAGKDTQSVSTMQTDKKEISEKSAESNVEVTNEEVASLPKNEGEQALFSISTYEQQGREILEAYVMDRVSKGRLTQDQADDIISEMEDIYNICVGLKDKYAPFGNWSEAEVIVDEQGKPVFSVIKANGDYAMNLDFSLVCKKRRTLDAVLREMIDRGIINNYELGQVDMAKINDIIRQHGFETACRLCFVDAKRFRVAQVADVFCEMYNALVDKSDAQLKKISKKEGKSVPGKIARMLIEHPENRVKLSRENFMDSKGFEDMTVNKEAVMKLYNAKKGTGGPKASYGDTQYLNDILGKQWSAEAAYEVGGVRLQSFSDYVPRMVFDYIQMVADLSAKGLPVHAYTKEPTFAKQFGLTGIKINLSLVPRVEADGVAPGLDANGEYVWQEGETFPYEEAIAIQNAEGYKENCGTIAVGVSDAHIEKMLSDDNIRMVIPYHKSGLNPLVAKHNNIDQFQDYTNEQNTRDANGNKLTKAQMKSHFNFNADLHKHGNPRLAAQHYLEWCDKKGYIPKFEKFREHPNYYKLLEDFTTCVTENGVDTFVPQGAVTMTFPNEESSFGSIAELIEEGLEEDAVLEGRRQADLGSIVDDIESEFAGGKKFSLSAEHKQKQLDIILESNPAEDDYHTWIRTVDDIKSFEEALDDSDYADFKGEDFDPSYTWDMVEEALQSGEITVYSSKPIKNGGFVTPSRMEAESYSGDGKVYKATLPIQDIAWIDPTQGPVAKVEVENADIRYSIGQPYDYEKYPLGRVEPGLNSIHSIEIVKGSLNHGFRNYKDAENWAKKNIARTYTDEETGGKGVMYINNDVIDKYVSEKTRAKSTNEDLHYAVLKMLPELIRTSIEVETHPNFKKINDVRKPENGYDKNALIHRMYAAADIDGVLCKVLLTIKEPTNNGKKKGKTKPYSFEVEDISMKIELMEPIGVEARSNHGISINSISTAKLLENVTMSYDKSRFILHESANAKSGVQKYSITPDILAANERFNEELQMQIDGTLPQGHVYQLGMPSAILRSTGIPSLPIQMNATRLLDKATNFGHDYNLDELKGLVKELNQPIAVFKYGNPDKAQNIILELQSNGKNFVVGMSLRPKLSGVVLEINSIRNVLPKDNAEWLNWITQDKLLYVDKNRIQNLIDQQRTILADVEYLDLDSVTKVVENFQNPPLPEDESSQNDTNATSGEQKFRRSICHEHRNKITVICYGVMEDYRYPSSSIMRRKTNNCYAVILLCCYGMLSLSK